MESREVWPGIDSALHELGMLCRDGSNRGYLKGAPERGRVHHSDINLTSTMKCHDRYLMPSQAWNRPGILTEVGGISSQSDSVRNICQPTDGENTENAYSVKGSRIIKQVDHKSGVALANVNPYSPCHSESIRENEGPSVLKMNVHYMTGVSIATAGASTVVFGQSDSYLKPINPHTTPKHGLAAPSVRHHHMRPYEIPWRRDERIRTKSETAEKEAAMKLMDRIDVNYPVIESMSKSQPVKYRRRLLKSRSLENMRFAEDEILQVPVHEVDFVSNRIQHLHVDE